MIKPLPGYVLILPIEEEEKSAGGIYMPESAKDKPSKGKVLAIGEVQDSNISKDEYAYLIDGFSDFLTFNPPVKVGQTVIYKKWTNQEVQHEGKEYLLVKFDELLGVIE